MLNLSKPTFSLATTFATTLGFVLGFNGRARFDAISPPMLLGQTNIALMCQGAFRVAARIVLKRTAQSSPSAVLHIPATFDPVHLALLAD